MKILACNSNKELAKAISNYIGIKFDDLVVQMVKDASCNR